MKIMRITPSTSYILTHTLKIGVPVAIQSALVAILSLADVLMVSSFGKEATAAVGLASKWHFVAIMIMAGLATASGILVAQFWGKSDTIACKVITLHAAKVGVAILLPISIAFVWFAPWILQIQTSDLVVIALGSEYLLYASPVLILTHLVIITESTMRSTGDSLTPLAIAALTIVVNIALNYLLITGQLGLPPMGVAGAALATTIARLLQMLTYVFFFSYKQHWLTTTSLPLKKPLCHLSQTYNQLALPAVASALLWAIGTMIYQVIFGHMGTLELAVYSTLGPFESLCYALFFGLSVACSVIIGQNLGRREFATAMETSQLFTKMFTLLGLVTTLLLLLVQPWLLRGLNLDSELFLPLSQPAMTILSIAISLKMLNMVIINGILRAGGENTFCLKMDFIAMWLFGLPLTAIAAFVMHYSFEQVYMMMLVEEIIKLTLCWRRYRTRLWLRDLTTPHNLADNHSEPAC
ncbi:MATE family efflux transporter [Vibrio cincinnatiensis]|uniref:MATE family efflux transporter n=1 Tax=Vibrio cincinnatiensis TaxID=675 RepID=UPI003D350B13